MRVLSLGGADLAELSTGILGRGGTFCFQAHGASMAPAIRDGDLLTVQPVKASELRIGEVALYRLAGDRLAAHRIVTRYVQDGRLVLMARGDAALGPNEQLYAAQVLGRVVRVQRGEKTLDLDRGPLYAAARLWVATLPLGPLFLRGLGRIKQLAAWLLRRLQSWGVYRILVRNLVGRRVRYRAATALDAPALSTLYSYGRLTELQDPVGAWSDHLVSLDGCGYAPVASLGGGIVGAMVIKRSPDDTAFAPAWWIWGMLVNPRYRGAGIGQGLVRQGLTLAHEAGASAVHLRVSGDNRAAMALYHKMGFRPATVTKDGSDRYAESGGILLVYPLT